MLKDYSPKYHAAGHKYIIPYILEISEEKGFICHSLGESFIHKENIPVNIEHIALGSQSIANGSSLEYFKNAVQKEEDKTTAEKEYERKKAGSAIRWYIINHGHNIQST